MILHMIDEKKELKKAKKELKKLQKEIKKQEKAKRRNAPIDDYFLFSIEDDD